MNNVDPTGKAMINAVCAAIGAIAGWYFGAWIANRLGYYSGWKYWAIRSGVIVGGAVIGWFAGTVMAYLIRCFIFSSPKMISATPLWVYKFLGIAAGPGTIVLGRYPMYLSLASKLGSGVFSIATSVWNGMSEFARWSANKAFLDKAIQAGKKITLSSNAYKAKPGSYFYKEIQYLLSRGYKIVKNGWEMVKK